MGSVDVVDQRGLAFERVHGGVVAYNNKTPGWWEGGGSMKPIGNVDLPEIIFVRWQSLVEPQKAYCVATRKVEPDFAKMISIGMAPGGIAKAWVGGPCLEFKEIGRFQARVSKVGPYKGTSGGKHRPLSQEAKAYIEQHGIPYGSW